MRARGKRGYTSPVEPFRIPRARTVFFAAACAAALVSCGAARTPRAVPGAASSSGAALQVLANDHPWVRFISRRLPEFTAATGVAVDIRAYPEEQFRAKRTVEMLSGISAVDAFMIMPGNSLSEYRSRGWVLPLEDLAADPRFLSWSPDFGDFYPSALDAGVRGDRLYAVPILLETSILAYDKRLFAEHGIRVPRSFAELEAAARTVVRATGGRVAGITMRGKGAAATSQWADFLHSFGGSWLDAEGKANIAGAEALAALDLYGRLLREYGPREAGGNGWYESLSVFVRGEAAMIYDANVFRSHYEDSSQSAVAGRVGYARLPAGPAGSVPHISHWGLAVHAGTRNEEAARLFILWATCRERALEAQLEGIPSARPSVWADPAFVARDGGSEWTAASTESYAAATFQWNPPVIAVDEARAVVGEAISAAILGQDAEAAARKAAEGLDAVIARERERP